MVSSESLQWYCVLAASAAVDGHGDRFQPVAVELQQGLVRASAAAAGIAPQLQLAVDQHFAGVEVHVEFDAVDEERAAGCNPGDGFAAGFRFSSVLLVCRLARQ
jgi:hypothetical protein